VTFPRIFQDPQNGVPYLFGAPFPAAHANSILTALRYTEKALYRTTVQNWFGPTLVVGQSAALAMAFDATLGLWAIAASPLGGGNMGVTVFDPSFDTTSSIITTTAASTSSPTSAASSDLGCVVFGLTPVAGTASKIMHSTNGTTWALRSIGSSNTKAVSFIRWDPSGARFVALVSTGECYTSPDGITWTSRTVPAGLSAVTWKGLAVSSTGFCVATANATTNYMTSNDGGTTWVQRTGPVTGAGVTYAPGLNVTISGATGVFAWGLTHVSTDGISWSSTTLAPPASASGVCKLLGMGPMFVAVTTQIGGTGGGANVEFAYDQVNPNSWALGAKFRPADGFGGIGYAAASQNQVAIVENQSTGAVVYRSVSLGY
jgi:hypothetical protein